MDPVSLFIISQLILLPFITLHDWVHIPPLTDIRELEKHSTTLGRFINSLIYFLFIFIPLTLTVIYREQYPFWVLICWVSLYGLLTVGTIFAWWIPYLFGSTEKHKQDFIEYQGTHHFLPKHGNNVIPNTMHVILHLQIWLCFVLSLYFFISYLLNLS